MKVLLLSIAAVAALAVVVVVLASSRGQDDRGRAIPADRGAGYDSGDASVGSGTDTAAVHETAAFEENRRSDPGNPEEVDRGQAVETPADPASDRARGQLDAWSESFELDPSAPNAVAVIVPALVLILNETRTYEQLTGEGPHPNPPRDLPPGHSSFIFGDRRYTIDDAEFPAYAALVGRGGEVALDEVTQDAVFALIERARELGDE